MELETLEFAVKDHVATVTLNRPDRLNSFNQTMCDEFSKIWAHVRDDDDIHVAVIRAAGERAFCTGVDVKDGRYEPDNLWNQFDPGIQLGPKRNQVWKPIVCAIHGMAAGGAFYWINESDIVLCSDDATFFDPHVTYGRTAALEPIGLARRIPLGEVLRIALLGLDERVSAERALQIGLVSEIVPRDQLWDRADELAHLIADKPTISTQGTVRAIWESLDATLSHAQQTGLMYTQIGNPIGKAQIERTMTKRPRPRIR